MAFAVQLDREGGVPLQTTVRQWVFSYDDRHVVKLSLKASKKNCTCSNYNRGLPFWKQTTGFNELHQVRIQSASFTASSGFVTAHCVLEKCKDDLWI